MCLGQLHYNTFKFSNLANVLIVIIELLKIEKYTKDESMVCIFLSMGERNLAENNDPSNYVPRLILYMQSSHGRCLMQNYQSMYFLYYYKKVFQSAFKLL